MTHFAKPLGRLLASLGALALALPAQALPSRAQVLALCSGGRISLPVEDDSEPPARKCPFACHMAGERKRADTDEDEAG